MKRYKRGFTIVEVVISMAMILIISLAAYFACVACSTAISNAKKSSIIISRSHSLIEFFNYSVQDENALFIFENYVNSSFKNEVLTFKSGDLNKNGVLYNFQFNCGDIQFVVKKTDFNYQIEVKSFIKNSKNEVYEYQGVK